MDYPDSQFTQAFPVCKNRDKTMPPVIPEKRIDEESGGGAGQYLQHPTKNGDKKFLDNLLLELYYEFGAVTYGFYFIFSAK
jgi:hypothetical protein